MNAGKSPAHPSVVERWWIAAEARRVRSLFPPDAKGLCWIEALEAVDTQDGAFYYCEGSCNLPTQVGRFIVPLHAWLEELGGAVIDPSLPTATNRRAESRYRLDACLLGAIERKGHLTNADDLLTASARTGTTVPAPGRSRTGAPPGRDEGSRRG
ncbi:MAG: hypothetical protein HY317_03170 [Acidobacteria bacterium]|nr:hypothetical protein [Acidobacteriota bacterium]